MAVFRLPADAPQGALVSGAGALLSVASAGFVAYVASAEPFLFMTTPTLVLLETLGLGLLVLFGIWGLVALSVARRLRSAGLRTPAALLVCAWTLVCWFYLGSSMASCWEDYRTFRHGVNGTLGNVAVEREARPVATAPKGD